LPVVRQIVLFAASLHSHECHSYICHFYHTSVDRR
jgi:hypothetical protein